MPDPKLDPIARTTFQQRSDQQAKLLRHQRINALVLNAQAAADELHKLQNDEPVNFSAQEAVMILDAIQKLAVQLHLHGPDFRHPKD